MQLWKVWIMEMFISQYGHSLCVLQLTIIIIKPTLNQVYPRKRGWPDLPLQQSLILHLTQFMASFFSKPMLLLSFSTCIFDVFFGHPGFLLTLTSNSNTYLRTCPSCLLNICPYHLTPFTSAIWTAVSFNPNISISLLSPLLSQSFLKLSSHFPSNTMSHSHITLPILHNSDRPFLSASTLPILHNSDRPFLSASARTWISHFGIPWTSNTKEK